MSGKFLRSGEGEGEAALAALGSGRAQSPHLECSAASVAREQHAASSLARSRLYASRAKSLCKQRLSPATLSVWRVCSPSTVARSPAAAARSIVRARAHAISLAPIGRQNSYFVHSA